MIAVSVDAQDTVRRLTTLARQCPVEMGRAIAMAASIVLRKVRAFTSHGRSKEVPAVAPRSPLSAYLRGPSLFGRLSRRRMFRVVRTGQFSRGITPMDWARDIVAHVQDGRRLRSTRESRHELYLRVTHNGAGRRDLIPIIHANPPAPPRPFVPSIAEESNREFPKWIDGSLRKLLSAHLNKGMQV